MKTPADVRDLVQNMDIDLDRYLASPDASPPAMISPGEIKPQDATTMAAVGIDTAEKARSGTYIQRDFYPLCLASWSQNIDLLPLGEALKRYPWLREKYYWRAVPADLNRYTARCAAVPEPQGFYIHVKKGARIPFPVQACLYMTREDTVQTVHNIIILEEGAELNLITGCAMRHGLYSGAHIGVTESYIGPRAKLINTMVHSWSPDSQVRPHAGTIVDAGGTYIDNYCCLRPARNIQSNPRTWLNGQAASAKYMTIILGSDGSVIDTGGEVYLNAEKTSAELAHRAVCTGGAIYQRGILVGNAPCRAHVDCAGMVLDAKESGFIQSIPGLRALHPDARMSHEASIGKIAPEQVEYLQSRGLDEREAISLLIRGFLGADLFGLGLELDARIAEIAELAGHGEE